MSGAQPRHEPQHWLDKAERLLLFMRHRDLVAAVDAECWLFKANALDQVAAFLQNEDEQQDDASGLSRD